MNEVWIDRFITDGVAFIPINAAPYGDHIQLLCRDGEIHHVNRTAVSFLQAVVQVFGVDLSTLRKQYGQAIGRKQLIPIPLSRAYTLVPFKTRMPIGNQVTTGWFVAEEIQSFLPDSKMTALIRLVNKQVIKVFHDEDWCLRQMRHVVLAQHRYQHLHSQLQNYRIHEAKTPYRTY